MTLPLSPAQIRQIIDMRFCAEYAPPIRVIAGKLKLDRQAVQICVDRAEKARLVWPLIASKISDEELRTLFEGKAHG